MIVLILFITAFGPVSAQQYPDYFAVSVGAEFFENSEYKVFTRMDCIDPVYIHDGNGNYNYNYIQQHLQLQLRLQQ